MGTHTETQPRQCGENPRSHSDLVVPPSARLIISMTGYPGVDGNPFHGSLGGHFPSIDFRKRKEFYTLITRPRRLYIYFSIPLSLPPFLEPLSPVTHSNLPAVAFLVPSLRLLVASMGWQEKWSEPSLTARL